MYHIDQDSDSIPQISSTGYWLLCSVHVKHYICMNSIRHLFIIRLTSDVQLSSLSHLHTDRRSDAGCVAARWMLSSRASQQWSATNHNRLKRGAWPRPDRCSLQSYLRNGGPRMRRLISWWFVPSPWLAAAWTENRIELTANSSNNTFQKHSKCQKF